jgi:hypothetical protein
MTTAASAGLRGRRQANWWYQAWGSSGQAFIRHATAVPECPDKKPRGRHHREAYPSPELHVDEGIGRTYNGKR